MRSEYLQAWVVFVLMGRPMERTEKKKQTKLEARIQKLLIYISGRVSEWVE